MFKTISFKETQLMFGKTDFPTATLVKEGNWAYVELGVLNGIIRIPFVSEILFEEIEPNV